MTMIDRYKAIELLVAYYGTQLYNYPTTTSNSYIFTSSYGQMLLRGGFKGFTAMSDEELLDELRDASDADANIRQFLNELMDGILLKG